MPGNNVYKDILLEVTIDARRGSRTQAIETRATFFSHDIKSGLVKINLQKDGEPLPLAVGTEILVSLTKPFEKGKGKLIYSPEIVDRDNGVAHWPIPEQIQGETGIFRAGVYVRYPNGQRIHGGYFTFQKEISEIDEEMEPWTESYWQGWAEFQEEAETAWSEWQANREYDWTQWTTDQQQKQDAFEADTNAQMSTLTKQLNDLELQTDELDQKQKYLIAQLADYMTKEQFVRFLAGETIEIVKSMDLNGKIPNSLAENPNAFSCRWNEASTPLPSAMTWTPSIAQYRELYALDGSYLSIIYSDANRRTFYISKWNLLEQISRDFPNFYQIFGATSMAEKITIAKEKVTSLDVSLWGYGQSPTGNYLSTSIWLNNSAWGLTVTSDASTFVKVTTPVTSIDEAISNNGYVYQLAQSKNSDGVTAVGMRIDYAQLTYSLRFSLYDFVPKKSEVYDKTQADQRFVSLSENQTIGGIKNFKETPLVNEVPVEIDKRATYSITGTTQAAAAIAQLLSEATMTLTRKGDQVFLAARINPTASTLSLRRNDIKVFDIPIGYQRSNDFVGGANNIAGSIACFTTSSISANAIIERLALYFNSSGNGNHYITASWMTDDPFPEN